MANETKQQVLLVRVPGIVLNKNAEQAIPNPSWRKGPHCLCRNTSEVDILTAYAHSHRYCPTWLSPIETEYWSIKKLRGDVISNRKYMDLDERYASSE